MITIHPRIEWATAPWAGTVYTVPTSIRTAFMVHYEGGTPTTDSGIAMMRNIDTIHRNNGWCGIGYNFVIDNTTGEVWEGRGWDLVGAHCPSFNRIGYGVQIHVGGDQAPSDEALNACRVLYDQACVMSGHTLSMYGHKDGYATECPGNQLEDWVKKGMPMPNGLPGTLSPGYPNPTPKPGTPAPAYPLPAGWYFGPMSGPVQSVSGYYSHRNDLAQWQQRMRYRGWDIKPDGLYGPITANVARHFQTEKRLTVDGLIGPQTWAAAWTAPIN